MSALLLPVLGLAGLQQEGTRVPRDDLPRELPTTAPGGLPGSIPGVTGTAEEATQTDLGRRLFFDPILSVDRSVACATCHQPARGFADATALSTGVAGKQTTRNAPSLLNRAYGRSFMWDGRAESLEAQVLLPIENELEMALPLGDAIARLNEDADYRQLFEAAHGGPATRERLALSLAGFVRRLLLADSPIDRFRQGQFQALDPSERAGLWMYESRGGCWRCHSGANFTDESFHNTGVGAIDGRPLEGRFAHTGKETDRGRFKTPTLRGLANTAPYMHDGSLATLEEVVSFYREGGRPNTNLDGSIQPIEMSDEDAANLVAFLRALSRTTE